MGDSDAVSRNMTDAMSGQADATGAHRRGRELIREGFLLHHGFARDGSVEDATLAGDLLYADGLVLIADDRVQVETMAERIIAASAAVAAGDIDRARAMWGADAPPAGSVG